MDVTRPDWIKDCQHWRRRTLTGRYAHWCFEWDGLPVDETTPEWPCGCFEWDGEPITSENSAYRTE